MTSAAQNEYLRNTMALWAATVNENSIFVLNGIVVTLLNLQFAKA